MNKGDNATLTISQAIRKSAMGLAIFAFFTAGIISITQQLTADTIDANEKAFEARLLLSILPSSVSADDILDSALTFTDANIRNTNLLHVTEEDHFYPITDQGAVTGVILPVIAPEGYSEAIHLIVGINSDGNIFGVRVTKHKETPGLGDQVETTKSDWIYKFNNTSLTQPEISRWQVKKDGGEFDQLTGATITPRAIVKAVKNSLLFFKENQSLLLNLPEETKDAL